MIRPMALAVAVSTGAAVVLAADWPAFRGPNGDGIAHETNVPTEWGPDKNIKWKVPLPGPANGSPIVSAGRVFLTCTADRGAKRSLYCLDRTDGRELWVRTVEFEPGEATHQTNPYGGTTPAADGKRVVVFHGSAGLYCYDFDGQELWSIDLGDVKHMWGYGTSPIIYRGKVILNFGPGEETFVTAVDVDTGKMLWKTEEPGGSNRGNPRLVGSWSTPIIANVGGKEQILCSMPTRVVAYDPDDGTILWTCGGLPSQRGDLVYTSMSVAGDLGVALGGYSGPAIGFRLGATGDAARSNPLWRNEAGQPQRIGSGVIVGDYFYIANAGPGTAQCIELATGKTVWQHRLPGNHWGSLVLAGGKLYATSQDGTTTVFLPDPEKYEEIAVNRLREPTNATPAFSEGEIFLRTDRNLYCIADL